MLTCTHTKTYAELSAWASTLPWGSGDHSPIVGDLCAEERCDEPLLADEVCYAVTELPKAGEQQPWVCWRHVRPDDGPIKVTPLP